MCRLTAYSKGSSRGHSRGSRRDSTSIGKHNYQQRCCQGAQCQQGCCQQGMQAGTLLAGEVVQPATTPAPWSRQPGHKVLRYAVYAGCWAEDTKLLNKNHR